MATSRRIRLVPTVVAAVLTATLAASVVAEGARRGDPNTFRLANSVSAAEPPATTPSKIDLGDDGLEVLGVYPILDGDTISADADRSHREVFERFAEVIPAHLRPDVSHFVAIDMERSGDSDGAMQQPVDDDYIPIEGQFYIALDTTGTSEGAALERTIVHEFAHLFTLRPGQVAPPTVEQWESGESASCPIFADPECPTEDSYIAAYYAAFPGKRKAKYDTDVYPSDYATTHPLEDIAEVFAEWVLNDIEPPAVTDDGVWREVEPGSVLDMKLDFFDGYPELVEARVAIRDGLQKATPDLNIGWPLASIPRDLAVDCSSGAAATEVDAWKVATCPWNDGEAEATYVYFRTRADLADWWKNERAGVARKRNPVGRCKNGRPTAGVWRYGNDQRAGGVVCDLVESTSQAKLAWTQEDLLMGVRVEHEAGNLRRLVNRWNAGDFDVD